MSDLGTDLAGIDDLAEDGRTVSGRRALAEAIARRWQTPNGRLLDDAHYGFDLTQYLNSDVDENDLAQMTSGAEAEALKDERVLSITCTTTFDIDGVINMSAALTDADGPFTLVVAITQVTVDLLSVT